MLCNQSIIRHLLIGPLVGLALLTLAACGGGGSSDSGSGGGASSSAPTPTYTVGGSISGLTTTGLVLQLNGGNNVAVASNATTYALTLGIASGQPYTVTVSTQPTNASCAVASGSGIIASANVTNVAVTCTVNFTVTTPITGLNASGLVLQLNNANNATIPSGSTTFTFPTSLPTTQGYAVSILSQPTGLTCSPGLFSSSNGSGLAANINTATITCVTTPTNTYTVGGTITNLTGSGLTLGLYSGPTLISTNSPAIGTSTFTFATRLLANQFYSVSFPLGFANQPTGQNCTLANGGSSSTVATANVTNVAVTCVNNPTSTVSGSITGLTAAGLKLTLNRYTATDGAMTPLEEITLNQGASTFAFSNTYTSLTNVAVRVSSHPTGLTCIVANPGGIVGAVSITTPQVRCGTRTANTLVGTYKLSTENGVAVVADLTYVTFFADGSYTLAENGSENGFSYNSVEHGIYNWNQPTGAFTAPVVAVDGGSDPTGGLSSLATCCTVNVTKPTATTLNLAVTEAGVTDIYGLTTVTNTSGSLTGSWLIANMGQGRDFVVFTGNTYMWSSVNLLTTANSTNVTNGSHNGVENACYTATTSTISPTFINCFVVTGLAAANNNGNAGLLVSATHPTIPAQNALQPPAFYTINGDTMTWFNSNGIRLILTRITN